MLSTRLPPGDIDFRGVKLGVGNRACGVPGARGVPPVVMGLGNKGPERDMPNSAKGCFPELWAWPAFICVAL